MVTESKTRVQPASGSAFALKDCALIIRMGGVDSAVNLRELRERIAVCPVECLYHHFCETQVRPTFDDPEFRNDFAVWASRDLRDRVLAERLGILNPFAFAHLEELRETLIEIIDDRLAEVSMVPWVRRGDDFRFMRSSTVAFSTGDRLETADDLLAQLPEMTPSTIYYHFIDARRRNRDRIDDFTHWLQQLESPPEELIDAYGRLDFYFLSLGELQQNLIEVTGRILRDVG